MIKYNVEITVNSFGTVNKVSLPAEFKLPEKDDGSFKVWGPKENVSLVVDGQRYKIKKLHFVYSNDPVLEDIQGIAIQRGGMKITTIPMPYAPRDIANKVYGYVTLEPDLELALLKEEGPEHYSYVFRKAIPKALKRIIENELSAFGREKLGLWVDPAVKQKETENEAAKQAVYTINRIARKLGIAVRGFPPERPTIDRPPRDRNPLRVELTSVQFPRETRRVNYGEEITDVKVRVVNQTEDPVELKLQLYLLKEDEVLVTYLDEDILLGSRRATETYGPFSQRFTPKEFPRKGAYKLRARIVSLMKPKKGEELHKITRIFYLEEEPPEQGLFEKCIPIEFPLEVQHLMGEAIPGDAGYVLRYNTKHPAKPPLYEGESALTEYFVTLMANEIPWITIRNDVPGWFEEDKITDAQYVAQKCSDMISRVLYEYYQG